MPDNGQSGNVPAKRDKGEIVPARASVQFKDWVMQQAEEGAEARAFEVASRQMDRILGEEDFDAIMDADMQPTYETRDLVDMELSVHPGIQFAKSDDRFNAPLGVYVQFTATALLARPTQGIVIGQELIISSGAPLVITKLRTLEANDLLPAEVVILGVQAPNGTVLKLGKVAKRAVKAETVPA